MNDTLYIVWGESNELGIPIIDEQHRGIVTTINSLHYLIQEELGIEALKPTLTILEQYTQIHFLTEESLMGKIGYPGIEKHVELHEELMRRTVDITKESMSNEDPVITLQFLRRWWIGHINTVDRKYVPYFKKILKNQ